MEKGFKVRDLRKKDQYKIDDKYLNGYAKLCGIYATCVYNSLSRHAEFHSQECFPSIDLIAEQHNISRPSAIKGIKKLSEYNIVIKIKEKDNKGRQKKNIYILLDKSEWKSIRVNEVDTEAESTTEQKPSQPQNKSRVNEVDYKDNKDIKDNKVEGIQSQAIVEKIDINKFIELFKEVNPSYERLFAIKGQRGAVERLFKKYGEEQLTAMIKALPQVNKMPYMPITITPYELEMNMGKIKGKVAQSKEKVAEKTNKIAFL